MSLPIEHVGHDLITHCEDAAKPVASARRMTNAEIVTRLNDMLTEMKEGCSARQMVLRISILIRDIKQEGEK